MEPSVRCTAKAVILREGKVLFIKLQYEDGAFYDLPGGGMNPGETLPEALRRECLEEIGASVSVGEVLCVYDFIAQKHERTQKLGWHQAVKIAFLCELTGEIDPELRADEGQVGAVWIPIEELHRYPHHPCNLQDALTQKKIYLGEVL